MRNFQTRHRRVTHLIAGCLALSSAGCGDDLPVEEPTGPIDGSWRISNITCNGQAANSTVRLQFTSGTAQRFIFSGNAGGQTINTSNCSVTSKLSLSYPADGQYAWTGAAYECAPASCDSARCGQTPSGGTYSFMANGDGTLTVTPASGTTDATCTAAGQQDPVVYTFNKDTSNALTLPR